MTTKTHGVPHDHAQRYRGRNPLGLATIALLIFLALTPPAHAQGCSECRESIGQTPARTQTAYRRGIFLMVVASGSIFLAGVVILRRFR